MQSPPHFFSVAPCLRVSQPGLGVSQGGTSQMGRGNGELKTWLVLNANQFIVVPLDGNHHHLPMISTLLPRSSIPNTSAASMGLRLMHPIWSEPPLGFCGLPCRHSPSPRSIQIPP